MSYYLYDAKGYLSDGPSIRGWEDFLKWGVGVVPIEEMAATGTTDDLEGLVQALESHRATGSVEQTRLVMLKAALHAEDVLILSDGVGAEEPKTLGGPGSGNFGHAGRPGQVGGSADRVTMTAQELRQHAIVALVYNELAAPAYRSKQDFSKMSPEDRVRLLDVSGRLIDKANMPVQIRTDRHNYDKNGVGAYAYSAFKREAEEQNWTPQQAFDEGSKRGLFVVAEGPVKGYEPMSSIGSSVSRFNILEGMDADERDRFEEAYIRTFADGKNRGEPIDSLEGLIKGGWTTSDLERFADRVQAAGGSTQKDYEDRSNIDAFSRTLAFYSKDYDAFRDQLFSGWASASNTASALTARGVAAQAFPLKAGKFYEAHLEDSSYGWTFNGYDPRVAFSPRAVENMRRLKSETEAFYKKQLKTDDLTTKPLIVMRAVGGAVKAYTPASVESWTTDARTVDRFGKMMGKHVEHETGKWYTHLSAEVTFDDVLWSYKSAKGQSGWPEEKRLKGKKEFVLLGSRVKKVEAKHVYL